MKNIARRIAAPAVVAAALYRELLDSALRLLPGRE